METVASGPGSEIENNAERATFPRLARFLDCSIFYGLLVVIALTAIPYGTVQPWWVALFECLVFVIAILAVIETFVGKRRPLNFSLAAPILVLILFALFQSVQLFSGSGPIALRTSLSADPFGTRLLANKLFALVLVALLLLRHSASKARLRVLIYFVIGVGIATACFGIIRKNFQTGPGFVLPALPISERGFAQFINRNHFALLMEMSLGLCLGLIFGEIRRYRRVLVLLLLSALMWGALIYSNSRGGIFASLGQFLFLVVLLDPLRKLTRQPTTTLDRIRNLASGIALRVILIVCLVVFFVYGVAWVGGESVVTNLQLTEYSFSQQGIDEQQRANTSRKDIWSSTWKLIKAHPLAGTGFGAYWIAITRYHNASGEFTPQEAHNDFLELLASGGLIGLALVTWFTVAFVRRARNTLHSGDPYLRAAAVGALTGIFGVMIHSFMDFGLHITANALVFCALLVIAAQMPHERPASGMELAQT